MAKTTEHPRSRRAQVTPQWFSRLALLTLIALGLIVISGAAVRLTGSGLGCPDWPSCYHHQLQASVSFHPIIEFGNRLVTIAITVLIAITIVAAHLRSPKRRDLISLSWVLGLGVVADAVLGGIVVYTKLNPYLVAVHMWLSLAMVVAGVVLLHRSKYQYGPGSRADVASEATRTVAWLLSAVFALVVIAGTAATGSGPHAGGSQGQLVAKRLPFALRDVVMGHAAIATCFVGLVAATFIILESVGAPGRLRNAAKRLLIVSCIQGAIGFIQYATHLPAWLVEIHVLGAVSLTMGVTSFQLSQVARDKETWAIKTPSAVPA